MYILYLMQYYFQAQAAKIKDVQNLNFEPRIAIVYGKISKHVDVTSGVWADDANKEQFWSSDPKEILK